MVLGLLQQRIEAGDPFGARLVAAQHVADAGRQPAVGVAVAHHATRDGGVAHVEAVAAVGDARAHHRQADLRRAQRRERVDREGRGVALEQLARRMRQHGEPALARGLRSGVVRGGWSWRRHLDH